MNASRPRVYRFHKKEQWAQCLLEGFGSPADDSVQPTERLGSRATRLVSSPPLSTIALDACGLPLWRRSSRDDADGAVFVEWLDDFGATRAFEIEGPFATSPRWIADRRAIWTFDPVGRLLARHDRETLQRGLLVDLPALDIADDGCGGVWVLAEPLPGTRALIRIDDDGRQGAHLSLDHALQGVTQMAAIERGSALLLMDTAIGTLWIVDGADGKLRRVISIAGLARGWTANRLASDGRDRVVLGGRQNTADAPWSMLVLDAAGSLVDGPLANLFPAGTAPSDLAARRGAVWFAMPDGPWKLDASKACGPRGTSCTLLTPALLSPATTQRGWLRAEVDAILGDGAALEIEIASTDDPLVAANMKDIAADTSRSPAARMKALWESLTTDVPAVVISGPSTLDTPISAPLHATRDRWLWLRLTLTVAPSGDTSTSEATTRIAALRVLYPEVSLMRYLPVIFRGAEGDPTGFLRGLVGVLEATTQDIDDRIAAIGRQIDPRTAPEPWLDYLAEWLDLPWDDALDPRMKRRILEQSGKLLAGRGTRDGLQLLLRALLDTNSTVPIVDLMTEHPPLVLGASGAHLPGLLAGTPAWVARLSGKAGLGRARLSCSGADCDPLKSLAPTVALKLAASSATRKALEPVLAGVLNQFMPAGVRAVVRWIAPGSGATLGDRPALEGAAPALLGSDSRLGRAIVQGNSTNQIDAQGLDPGFHLS